MKPLSVVLVLSLLGNIALLALVALSPSPDSSLPPWARAAASRDEAAGELETARRGRAAVAGAAAGAEDGSAAVAASWSVLSAGTPADMVARLRAAGYPPAVIRALVAARLSQEMRAHIRETLADVKDPAYWSTGRFVQDPKVVALQRDYYQEQLKQLKELLGPDAVDDNELNRYQRRRQFGDIAADKALELQRIAADYAELRNQVYREANGVLMPEDRRQVEYLEKELRADYAKILTPEELEACELRSSSTADAMRLQLAAFQPTEDEFRALFRAARQVEAQYGSLQAPLPGEQNRQRQAAVLEQAKAVLSPERYEAFAQATDPRYSMLNRIATRYELPAAVVPQVYAVQQEIQQRARSAKGPDRAAQLTVLAQEASTRIAPLLGERGFEAYKVYGGQWMDGLTNPPSPTNSRPTPTTTPATTKG